MRSGCYFQEASCGGKASFTSTDELAGLVKLPRDLRWLRIIQAASVAVIIAGSACIAMGRVVGIYLAACGPAAWFVTCLIHLEDEGLRTLA